MAQTPLKAQPWSAAAGRIVVGPGHPPDQLAIQARLELPSSAADLDPALAQIVWETTGQAPSLASPFTFKAASLGEHWIEAEALWPDGRRVFAATRFDAAAVIRDSVNLVARLVTRDDGRPGLQVDAVADSGKAITLQCSTNLVDWMDVAADASGSLTYLDNLGPGQTGRFFRVVTPDPGGR
jgi:hypothetical protein